MKSKLKLLSKITLIATIPSLIIWAIYFSQTQSFWGVPIPKGGMQTVIANYDGPLYIAIAKSFYNLEYIASHFSFPLPLEYYAAHFPLYPASIFLVAQITGYPWGSLIATQLAGVITIYFFYKLSLTKLDKDQALWLTMIFSFFPARWLAVKSVGSPEPLFVGSIIASVYYFNQKKFVKAGFWGAMAQLTKSPGILLFIAFAFTVATSNLKKLVSTKQSLRKWVTEINYKAWPVILIPFALLLVFGLYSIQFADFLAYFKSGDNIHLFFPPFQIFNYSQPWVNTHWLEEIIFVYLFALLGLAKLIKDKQITMAWFVGIFFTSLIFVSHRDIMRYASPIFPFILFAFAEKLQSREMKFILAFLALPILLFSLAYIANNAMPISDWNPLL